MMKLIKDRIHEIELLIIETEKKLHNTNNKHIYNRLKVILIDLKELKRFNEAILYQNPELFKQGEFLH